MNNKNNTQAPQAEIKQPEPATPKDVQTENVGTEGNQTSNQNPPAQKTKLTILAAITVVLGILSLVSLVLLLRLKSGQGLMINLPARKPPQMEKEVQETTESNQMEKSEKPGEFDPVEVVEELDELNLKEIEKDYLDSGLN